MAEPATNAIEPGSGDVGDCTGMTDQRDMVLRARDDVEQVAIETVHVGDYVFLDTQARLAAARCVLKKWVKVNERTSRIVGWLLEVTGGDVAWLPRGGLVWRRRALHA